MALAARINGIAIHEASSARAGLWAWRDGALTTLCDHAETIFGTQAWIDDLRP